jgi:beta-glucosidase
MHVGTYVAYALVPIAVILAILVVVCVVVALLVGGYSRVYDAPCRWHRRRAPMPIAPLFGFSTAPFQNERPVAEQHGSMWADFVRKLQPEGMRVSPNHADIATFERDLDTARRDVGGMSAMRFGVDWARVEPREGRFDDAALDAYAAMCGACRARGMCPVVTLHHFVEPRWFSRTGSFANAASVGRFAAFAAKCAARLGSFRPVFVTFNEPFLYAMLGYGVGVRPPFVSAIGTCLDVMCNVIRAHDAAYEALAPHGPVTIAKNLMPIKPSNPLSPVEVALAFQLHGLLNESYLTWVKTRRLCVRFGMASRAVQTRHAVDVLGVNHYTACAVRWDGLAPTIDMCGPRDARVAPVCATGWSLDARALAATLAMVDSVLGTTVPVLITEMGASQVEGDPRGVHRAAYARDCYAELDRYAGATGNLLGVLAWTMVDNFEWEMGTAARFGHYTIDREPTELLAPFSAFVKKALRRHGRERGGAGLDLVPLDGRLEARADHILDVGLPGVDEPSLVVAESLAAHDGERRAPGVVEGAVLVGDLVDGGPPLARAAPRA